MDYGSIAGALAPHGLIARGGFRPDPEDGLPADAVAAVMVGNAGPAMWHPFSGARSDEPDAMNRWTRRVLGPIAAGLSANALYPFDGPPWYPFQRCAQRAEPVFPSPIGMLIHPDFGLWHAYRGVLVFDEAVEGLPEAASTPNPCESCAEQPCLTTCPVGAFSGESYDVPACAEHLRTDQGADCLLLGCRARRACPVGRDTTYLPEQAAFHMDAFLASR